MTTTKNTKRMLVAAVCLQFSILIGLTVQPVMTLTTGKVVTLKTLPVDPYDMFRGDYVRLRYDMSSLQVTPAAKNGGAVYVALTPDGEYWKARAASSEKPALREGEICIKGVAKKTYNGFDLHFGIEQVYVPEKTGKKIEQAKALSVALAVDNNGNAAIKKVVNGNETVYDADNILNLSPQLRPLR